MTYEHFESLHVRVERRVAWVRIDHPPINLFDKALMLEFHYAGKALAQDDAVSVVVVESANPDFFIAHADLTLIKEPVNEELSFFQAMVDRFRTMPKVTIAQIEGRARGGGSELALAMDMRFAARGRAVLSQPEIFLGLIPGGGGTQRLARMVGRGRAMEIVLGGEDFDADPAERYGWVNRALPADEIGPFVKRLAERIATFPPDILALAKQAVNAGEWDLHQGLVRENRLFNEAVTSSAYAVRKARFLASGGQTAQVERDLGAIAERLGEP
jgi:enoyl-CoA hydratase/carnithine racemase